MKKTITVEIKTWQTLTRLKYKFGCETIDEAINRLLNILTKFKMQEEFSDIKHGKNNN